MKKGISYMVSFFDLFLLLFIGLASCFDLWKRRIPNWLIAFALAVGVLLNFWKGLPYLSASVLGFLVGMGAFLIPFVLGWVGAGDVKFVGTIGAFVGIALIPRVIFYSVLLGGVFALLTTLLNGVNIQVFKHMGQDLKLFLLSRGTILPEPVSAKNQQGIRTIPYGVAIALGTLTAFYMDPQGKWACF
jgi:prepilin peptidase CpaA